MSAKSLKLCAWSGIASLAVFLGGFLIAGFIPPTPAPGLPAHDMAAYFRDNPLRIRSGLLTASFGAALLVPWTVAVTVHMRRMEGGRFTPLAWTQMVLGGLFAIEFIIPFQILQSAAYRPERSNESIQGLIDTGWLMFMGVVSTLVLQGIVLGMAILNDNRSEPIWPRWSGYFSIWAVIITSPGGLVPFFHEGPFTWRGLFVWWIPLPAFAAWIIVFSILALRTADQRYAVEDQLSSGPDGSSTSDAGYATQADLQALRDHIHRLEGSPANTAPR